LEETTPATDGSDVKTADEDVSSEVTAGTDTVEETAAADVSDVTVP